MRRILTRLLLLVPILAGGLLFTLLGTAIFGRVTGVEFAPDSWERRTYTYYELPIFQIQVSSVTRNTRREPVEQELVNKKYVSVNAPPKRWDLVSSFRHNTRWRQGDAQILCAYLDAWNDDELYWLHWTNSRPELAAIFWPEVAKLAREQLYSLTPDLFELVAGVKDPTELARDLSRILAQRYEELADLEMELQNFETARRFYGEALSYEPTRATSLAGQERARQAAGRGVAPEPDHPPAPAFEAEQRATR
jgi:hypothetical protein